MAELLIKGEVLFVPPLILEVESVGGRQRMYRNYLKKNLFKGGYYELSEKIGQLNLMTSDRRPRGRDI